MGHRIEIAKSGRAGCRTCRKPIAKDELRFGEEVPDQFGGAGEPTYRWHHITCAASSFPSELKPLLDSYEGEIPNREELDRLMVEAEAKKPPPFPYADRAPTGRARCQGCGEAIAKDALRVAIERDIERGMTVTKGAGYLHPACAAAYVEGKGGTHAELTAALQQHSKLSEEDFGALFAEV